MRAEAAALAFLVAIALVASSCGGTNSSPTAPTVPACQTNNTATIYFSDRSNTNRTYDVLWDGSRLLTLAPGQTSDAYTMAAGVTHTLVFQLTNTSTYACNPSTPTLAQCSSQTFWCSY